MMLSHAQVVQHGSWPPGGRDIAVPATVAVATQGRLRAPGDKRWRTFDESQIQKLKLGMIKICMTIWNNMSMLNICVFSAKLRKCSITLPNWCCWMDSRQTQTSREMKRSWGAQWEQNGFTTSQPRSRLRRLARGAWPTQGLCFWSKAGTDPCAAWESWWRAFRSPSFWRIGDTPSLWFPIADYPLNCWLPIELLTTHYLWLPIVNCVSPGRKCHQKCERNLAQIQCVHVDWLSGLKWTETVGWQFEWYLEISHWFPLFFLFIFDIGPSAQSMPLRFNLTATWLCRRTGVIQLQVSHVGTTPTSQIRIEIPSTSHLRCHTRKPTPAPPQRLQPAPSIGVPGKEWDDRGYDHQVAGGQYSFEMKPND